MRSSPAIVSRSEDETRDIAIRIAAQLEGGERIALTGGLGAGKTAFARWVPNLFPLAYKGSFAYALKIGHVQIEYRPTSLFIAVTIKILNNSAIIRANNEPISCSDHPISALIVA